MREGADDGGVVAADGEFDSADILEGVERVAAVGLLHFELVLFPEGFGQAADSAADHQQIVIAEVVGVEQRDPERMGLVDEEFERQFVTVIGEFAKLFGFVANGALLRVEGVIFPRVECEAVSELMCEAGQGDGGFGGAGRMSNCELTIVFVAKGVWGKGDVSDVSSSARFPAHDAAVAHNAASETGADDRHEQARESVVVLVRETKFVPGDAAAANGVFAERRRLSISEIVDDDVGGLKSQRCFQFGAYGESIPKRGVEVRGFLEHAIKRRRAGCREAYGGDFTDISTDGFNRCDGVFDDRLDSGFWAFSRMRGELIADGKNLMGLVANGDGGGGAADVDA